MSGGHDELAEITLKPAEGQSPSSDETDGAPQKPADVSSPPGSLGELVKVAWPLVLSSGSLSLMSVVDRVMLTGYSPDALAAVTPASMLHWTVACVPMGTILYANTFIAQFDGAGQKNRIATTLWQAIWLAIVCGGLLALFIPYSHAALSLTGHAPAVVLAESRYFNMLCGGAVPLLVSTALSCFFSGRRRTRTVLWVNLFGVLVNLVLDYLLIFGHMGFPEMGIRGAALATVIARTCEIPIYLVLILRHFRKSAVSFWTAWRPDRAMLEKYLRYGFPSGLHFFADIFAFTCFLLIVGNFSRDALATTNLAFSVNSVIFVPLLGFGTAVQTVVGHHMGAGLIKEVRQTTWNAVRLSVFWTGVAGVLLVLFPETVLKPFYFFASERPGAAAFLNERMSEVTILLRFVALYSVFDALTVVFSSALRGAGDTVFPMIVILLSGWIVMVIPAFLLMKSSFGSINLLWATCAAHIAISGTSMLLRFLNGRWQTIRLVESERSQVANG
jgi:MATE family, multidrug efflux pump